MVVRVTFRLYITPKSVKIYTIFLYLDRILAQILAPPKLNTHCVKSVRIRSYFGPYFPVFGLNTDTFYAVTIGFHQTLNERTYSALHTPWLLNLVKKCIHRDVVAICLIAVVA